ncbi:MAG: response regulator transcription factor [Conexibacter sp.]
MSESPTGHVRIVIADDHRLVRAGLRLLLDAEPDFEVVAEAGDVPSALRCAHGRRPDVLLLDLSMPGGSAVDAIPGLVAKLPGTGVLVLTMESQPAVAREALRRGARGYVLKDSVDAELLRAVRVVAHGGTYLTPGLGAQLALDGTARRGAEGDLTRRELEILRLVALGHTNAEIAVQLFLSVRTVETHRAHVQQKLGRTTRAELVRWALDHGMLGTAAPGHS